MVDKTIYSSKLIFRVMECAWEFNKLYYIFNPKSVYSEAMAVWWFFLFIFYSPLLLFHIQYAVFGQFVSKPGLFSSLVWLICAGVNTAITLRCGPKQLRQSERGISVVPVKVSNAVGHQYDPESTQIQEVNQTCCFGLWLAVFCRRELLKSAVRPKPSQSTELKCCGNVTCSRVSDRQDCDVQNSYFSNYLVIY